MTLNDAVFCSCITKNVIQSVRKVLIHLTVYSDISFFLSMFKSCTVRTVSKASDMFKDSSVTINLSEFHTVCICSVNKSSAVSVKHSIQALICVSAISLCFFAVFKSCLVMSSFMSFLSVFKSAIGCHASESSYNTLFDFLSITVCAVLKNCENIFKCQHTVMSVVTALVRDELMTYKNLLRILLISEALNDFLIQSMTVISFSVTALLII